MTDLLGLAKTGTGTQRRLRGNGQGNRAVMTVHEHLLGLWISRHASAGRRSSRPRCDGPGRARHGGPGTAAPVRTGPGPRRARPWPDRRGERSETAGAAQGRKPIRTDCLRCRDRYAPARRNAGADAGTDGPDGVTLRPAHSGPCHPGQAPDPSRRAPDVPPTWRSARRAACVPACDGRDARQTGPGPRAGHERAHGQMHDQIRGQGRDTADRRRMDRRRHVCERSRMPLVTGARSRPCGPSSGSRQAAGPCQTAAGGPHRTGTAAVRPSADRPPTRLRERGWTREKDAGGGGAGNRQPGDR